MLKVENDKKAFGATTVLDGVILTVNPGEVVSIRGSSGSGKSTLIRCINGLEKLNAGRITVDDFDVSKPKELAEARKRSGTVFQLFNLYPHLTALQNITLAPIEVLKRPRTEAEADARALLASVGLGDRADAYPAQLSGGQRQRVGICRANSISCVTNSMVVPSAASLASMARTSDVISGSRAEVTSSSSR
jgi:ABC-type polar amino acid transport system ATPase subunit